MTEAAHAQTGGGGKLPLDGVTQSLTADYTLDGFISHSATIYSEF